MNGVVREVRTRRSSSTARWSPAGASAASRPAPPASPGCSKLLAEQVISPDETVVCILTGHELKDPNATVKYHTGIDMKAVQDLAPRTEPQGKLSNRPVQVEDDLEAIVKAMGGDPGMIAGCKMEGGKSGNAGGGDRKV